MITIRKAKDRYCNACSGAREKYYEIRFLNEINQGLIVNLCEEHLRELRDKINVILNEEDKKQL